MLADLIDGMPDMGGLSDRDLGDLLRVADERLRAAEAFAVAVVEEAARRGAHCEDGHRTITAWCEANTAWSHADAVHRTRTARLATGSAPAAQAIAANRIGVAQARELARVYANPRVVEAFDDDVAELLIGHATRLCFDDFRICTRAWERTADLDGAHRDADTRHRNRTATIVEHDGDVHLSARGAGLSAAILIEVFQRFCDAEFHTDWDTTVARHGHDATPALMPRTHAQRRFDALVAIFQHAVTAPPGSVPAEPLVNLVIDAHTFNDLLGQPLDLDPIDPADRRSETLDGMQLPPGDIIAAIWWGQIRRVVIDTAGVTIDMGRTRRLFTGAARDAVLMQSRRCVWPGCRLPAGRCQTDHLTEWTHNGPTNQHNGTPLCQRHNRHKNHGYTIHRHPDGTLHIHRPDGTEM